MDLTLASLASSCQGRPLGGGEHTKNVVLSNFLFFFSLLQLFSRSSLVPYIFCMKPPCVDFTQCGVPSRHDWHKSYVTLKHGGGVVIYTNVLCVSVCLCVFVRVGHQLAVF